MGMVSQYAGRKVLVTGGSGFIGSQLCRKLCELGAEVHSISRRHGEGCIDGLRWWRADVVEGDRVGEIIKVARPEIIFHLASLVAGSRDAALVLPILHSNLVSTVNVLRSASEFGCGRVVLTGSLEEPAPEDSDQIPCSPYAAAKWASSGYARMFHALYQLPVVTLRLFMVYGPGQQDLKKLIPYVVLSLLRKEAPKLSSGTRQVDWIYVSDVVEGFLAAGLVPEATGTVDIGSGELVTIRQVVERLVAMVDPSIQPVFGALPDRPMEQVRVADTATSARRIAWKPSTSLDQGLRQTVEWYAARPWERYLIKRTQD
jgi:nucleoside-diphosphate-sugar epimerase